MSKTSPSEFNPVNAVFLVAVPLLALTFGPWAYFQGALTPGIIALTLFLWFLDCYLITTLYHRCLSHKSYEMHPALKAVSLLFVSGGFQNSALVWCSDHRRHHSFEDTDADPYSINKGFFYAHWGWMFFKDPPDYIEKMPADLTSDKLVMFQHRYYLPLAVLMWLGFPTLVGWAMGNALGGLVFGGFVRLFLSTHSTFLINSAAHTFGKQTYSLKLTARDNWFLAFLTCGEGYHSFHHRFQNDYRNGHKWYHWDPTKWGIQLYAMLGLAKNLRQVSDEKILEAKLQTQAEARLQQAGIQSHPTLMNLKERLVEAQSEFKKLQSSFNELKRSNSSAAKEKMEQVKIELQRVMNEREEMKDAWQKQLSSLQTLSVS